MNPIFPIDPCKRLSAVAFNLHSAITVSAMARTVGLSRSRFHQLIRAFDARKPAGDGWFADLGIVGCRRVHGPGEMIKCDGDLSSISSTVI